MERARQKQCRQTTTDCEINLQEVGLDGFHPRNSTMRVRDDVFNVSLCSVPRNSPAKPTQCLNFKSAANDSFLWIHSVRPESKADESVKKRRSGAKQTSSN